MQGRTKKPYVKKSSGKSRSIKFITKEDFVLPDKKMDVVVG